ncbi:MULTISPECIES: hypothetical protein [Trichocoleus]|uniref:Uncharacterized protein n=1 Tax=Trichocoleus desertorum GB2-A4 TaxID=2933944 RepID=A0ABV0JF66_9CYAN|nr:hypothetical protein [Trichocoleus sp. FACHB-46]MBD1862333.1 hypothetical protein [Trichocoleus sp. FACHB-46]
MNELTNNSITKVIDTLRGRDINAQYWHSGGGIFGIMIWLPDGKSIFWGAPDGTWCYDYNAADGDHISSGFTDIPCERFDPLVLSQAITGSVQVASS